MGTSQASLCTTTSFCCIYNISLKTRRKKNKSHDHQYPKRLHQKNNRSNLSYPRPSLTPLLNNQTPQTQTRHQALDQVLIDLQSSIDRGVKIETSIFSSLLETCFQMQSLHHGILIHRLIPPSLLRKTGGLSSKLIHLYASCGLVEEAHHLFDEMPQSSKTAFAWNSLISGYTELGLYEDAMALYYQMEEEGIEPDQFTFPRVLKACAGIGSVRNGEAIHRHLVRSGFGTDTFVLNALVDMYAKCGDILKARQIFDKMPDRDLISWNSILTGYMRHGLVLEALDACRGMLRAGLEPDSIAISTMLSNLSLSSKLGLEIHGWVIRRGLEWNLSVANSLIAMYSHHARLYRAWAIFESMPEKDLVSWNAIISALRNDCRVLDLFRRMEDSGLMPDQVTFVSLLSACANLGLVEDGRKLFSEMEEMYKIRPGMEHYGCMVNMLGRAGLIDEAYELILKRMPFDGGPTVWGALLFACSVHGNVGLGEVAAERLFELEPDNEHNFELMMKIYRNAGRWEDLERVGRMMRERGLGE